jgi:hypothetical protein
MRQAMLDKRQETLDRRLKIIKAGVNYFMSHV